MKEPPNNTSDLCFLSRLSPLIPAIALGRYKAHHVGLVALTVGLTVFRLVAQAS